MSFFIGFIMLLFSSSLLAGQIQLSEESFTHIEFDGKVKPTKYTFQNGSLVADVNSSGSALLMSFEKLRSVKNISFKWKKEGSLNIKSIDQMKEKDGDDAYFRVALVVSGDAPFVPFFAPSWIKMIKKVMKLPSDSMMSYLASIKSSVLDSWPSPYTNSITNVLIPWKKDAYGWYSFEKTLDKEIKTVGLWLQADGDNTESTFRSTIKDLVVN